MKRRRLSSFLRSPLWQFVCESHQRRLTFRPYKQGPQHLSRQIELGTQFILLLKKCKTPGVFIIKLDSYYLAFCLSSGLNELVQRLVGGAPVWTNIAECVGNTQNQIMYGAEFVASRREVCALQPCCLFWEYTLPQVVIGISNSLTKYEDTPHTQCTILRHLLLLNSQQ